MYKLVALLKRHPDLSPEAFREYYETRHAPLAQTLIPGLRRYIRRYLKPLEVQGYPASLEARFDVITELWFENAESFEQAKVRFTAPEVAALLLEDEMKLFDRQAGLQFIVDEAESEPVDRS